MVTFNSHSLQTLMTQQGLSARELARRINVAPSLIGAWLSGVVSPQIATVCRLCNAFNLSIDFFFVQEGDDADKAAVESARTNRAAIAGGRR